VTFVVPVSWLALQPGFTISQIWTVSVVSVTLQALLSGVLALRQLRRSLAVSPGRG
jgi:hypothetical protein